MKELRRNVQRQAPGVPWHISVWWGKETDKHLNIHPLPHLCTWCLHKVTNCLHTPALSLVLPGVYLNFVSAHQYPLRIAWPYNSLRISLMASPRLMDSRIFIYYINFWSFQECSLNSILSLFIGCLIRTKRSPKAGFR